MTKAEPDMPIARVLEQSEYGNLLHKLLDAMLDHDRTNAKTALTLLVYAHRAALNRISELDREIEKLRALPVEDK